MYCVSKGDQREGKRKQKKKEKKKKKRLGIFRGFVSTRVKESNGAVFVLWIVSFCLLCDREYCCCCCH